MEVYGGADKLEECSHDADSSSHPPRTWRSGLLPRRRRVHGCATPGRDVVEHRSPYQWHRFSADLRYQLARQVGVAVGYWYEKLDVKDFNTIDLPGQPGSPRIDSLGEINTGYGNRPYKGSTTFVRLLYSF